MTLSPLPAAEPVAASKLDQHHARLYRALRAAFCSADEAFDARLDEALMHLPDPVRPTYDEFDILIAEALGFATPTNAVKKNRKIFSTVDVVTTSPRS